MNKKQIDVLGSLIDKNAISFLKTNEKEYEAQYNTFLKINNVQYVVGIDVSNCPDKTGYSPL